jgi:hypothetical protein
LAPFALLDDDRDHLVSHLDINNRRLRLAAPAIGDGSVHHLGLDGVPNAEEILAGHIPERLLGAA